MASYGVNSVLLLAILPVALFITSIRTVDGRQIIPITIDEGRPKDYAVYTFDSSSGDTFSFYKPTESKAGSWLKISDSGSITTTTELPYNVGEKNVYDITVIQKPSKQTDGGKAHTLRLTVRDVNNFSPSFAHPVYYAHVAEGSPTGVIVDGLEKCYAEDRDSPQAGSVQSYSISSGNEKGYFAASFNEKDGRKFLVLKTTSTVIKRDPKNPDIVLTIEAKDGGSPPLIGTTKISIRVRDSNNNAPVFQPTTYSANIDENKPVLSKVLRVSATDADVSTNGAIYYYMSTLDPSFSVDAITGDIIVARPLDYSVKNEHTLTIMAIDRGFPRKISAAATVKITINRDLPDYPPTDTPNPGQNTKPYFSQPKYSFSIAEDFPTKGALLFMRASDNDPVGPNKRLTYSLSGGDGKFRIDPNSGLVTLASQVDYNTAPAGKAYTVTITATDQGNPVQQTTTNLVIDIQEVNKNRNFPIFDEQQVAKTIDESARKGDAVYKATAKDADSGDDGKVVYSIEAGSGLGYFKIDPNTGSITVDAPLDREKESYYDLVIRASDSATFPLDTRMFLMINLKDINDNNPYFTQPMYLAKVPEQSGDDTFVTLVSAKDPDEDPKISYSLDTFSQLFDIDSQTGIVRTSRALTGNLLKKKYELLVSASSSGAKAGGQINITITSEEDKPPVFKNLEDNSYKVAVPENMGPIPNLKCIAAVDSNGKPVSYRISSGADNIFGLDENSGRLYSTKGFDYEEVDRYNLRIEASTGSSSDQVASVPVAITVKDSPDPPKFLKSSYVVSISENTGVGTTISARLVIDDRDTSTDQFDCSLENVNSPKVTEYFRVVLSGGECKLVIKKKLDSYDVKEFKFDVQATDENFRHMYARASLVVKVDDVNDHKPVFSKTSYWVSIASGFKTGTKLVELSAVDRDTGTNGEVRYDLVRSQDSQKFRILNNDLLSAVTLAPNVRYQVQVTASDIASTPQSSKVTVYVSVYDPSESPVVFDKSKYTKSLSEEAAKNTPVFKVRATKSGVTTGITYELVGGHKDLDGKTLFKIDSSGQVLLDSKLDRETASSHTIYIRATYLGKPVAMATDVEGVITVTDVNDNSPEFTFEGSSKIITVDNYTPQDSLVIKALAFDADDGPNGKVSYSIAVGGGSPPFKIDSNTGEIKASREIVFSSGAKYAIKIRSSDGGSPQKSTDFTLNIEVVNTPRPPRFKDNSYQFSVNEITEPGTKVGPGIQAEYSKAGTFLKYSFVEGNKDNTFCIDATGQLYLARRLDREKVSSYRLKVRVELGKSSDDTIVNVNVDDFNDDPPHFDKSVYQLKIEENKKGTLVPPVTAVDHDSGTNGEITYSILQSIRTPSKGFFKIDTTTGQLSVDTELDREKAAEHVLFIQAKDKGNPSLTSIAQVNIDVQDVNDNTPKFAAASYRAKIALDAAIDRSVIRVQASDLDKKGTPNGDLEFTILSGNNGDAFKINNQGVISIKKPLTTVADDRFTLDVRASDKGNPPRKADITAQINVYLPDGPPKFVVSPVTVYVTEGVTAGNRVTGVKAATSEALTYSIISGNEDLMFKINPSTGQLDATRTLDYEEKQRYELEIEARDTRDRSAAVKLIINVVNVNDNKPTFRGEQDGVVNRKAIGTCRPTNIIPGEIVASLGVTDKDKGDNVTFELDDQGKKYFEVDPKGNLRAKQPLTGIPSPFTFKVKAKDDGKPPQENEVDLRIVFVYYRPDQDPVRVDVREDRPVGSVIARVPRYLPNGTIALLYPEKANFSIQSNGDVILLSGLDYETQRFHSITVREKQPGTDLTNDVDVEITVLDVNDNAPYFTPAPRFAQVNTNSRAGAKVYQLNAEDDDGGSSGLVGYQLDKPETNARRRRRSLPQSPFTINPNTKQLEVAGPVGDKRYKMPVEAFDYGIPRLRSSPIVLNLDASKAGQVSPRFSQVSYSFKVREDAPYLTVIGTVKARSISGARLEYTIVEGNVGDKFKALENGNIVLNSLLDFERDQSVYKIKVRATEQIPDGLFSVVDVRIDVIDANDHVPYFSQMLYSVQIPENTGSGKIIHNARAYDCDCTPNCLCPSGKLRYSLFPNKEEGGNFAIDSNSGQVSVDKVLDYEVKKWHLIKIIASDSGKKVYRGICYLNVTLTNINDNSPAFSQGSYNFHIAEKASVGVPLAVVRANDPDGDVATYKGGNQQFKVESNTGVISLKSSLPSSKTQYTFQVGAEDPGGKNNFVSVRIDIDDANDNRPIFKDCKTKSVNIEENLPKGHRLTKIEATDKDRGKNGRITYTIMDAKSQSLFQIDSNTGEIRTLASLDRENKEIVSGPLFVIIKAEDGTINQRPSERLLDYCFLMVNVLDVNDNRPYFAEVKYYGSVINTAKNGTAVMTVQATDNDIGPNAEVKYSLLKDEGGLFRIDPNTGVVSTNADLTKYTKKTFNLKVAARDKQPRAGEQPGQNKLYSTDIEIFVSSRAPPKFTQSTYQGQVYENVDIGTVITTVKATPSTPGSQILYQAVNTNPLANELFRVDPNSGVISTGAEGIDYETITNPKKEYEIHVIAKETGADALYSTCKVIIKVLDRNDFTPKFKMGVKTANARVLENKNPGETVIEMVAYDKDTGTGKDITYSLKDPNNPNFAINSKTGLITTKTKLDREVTPGYVVTVIATDGGGNAQPASVDIIVVDQNDQPPVFKPKVYQGSVAEDAKIGTSILSVYATDKDIGDNAAIRYFISKGDPTGRFDVRTEGGGKEGVVFVNGKLDYEAVKSYPNIEITATDGKYSDTATVSITITDVNDIGPVFIQPMYTAVLSENTKPDVAVTTVKATDVDGPLPLKYSLDDNGKGYFVIDSNGAIKTGTTPLDREESPVKAFGVIASDGVHSTKAEVLVNLTDVNDNAPRFPSSPYIGYVKENKPAGTSVMYVQAVDDDDPFAGDNAKVTYSLTDSAGGKFKINPDTGKITTLATFDRETPPDRFKVKVKATDGGNPKLSGTVDATIIVTDENDFAPEFTEETYKGTVSERAPPGFRVTAVSATDKDTGPNAEFEFVVIDGNYPHAFYVDPYNGSVLVSGELDYETKKNYRLTVEVYDRGNPPKKGKKLAYVEIEVLDANDNAPIFVPKKYDKTIPETNDVGKEILKVTAIDKDSGTNGNITFSITGGNIDDIFEIKSDPKNRSIGIITNRLPVDREAIPVHKLEVTAKDPGGLTGTGDVTLTVSDVNDNAPWFVPPVFISRIRENTNNRQFVTKLSAIDPDEYVDGRTITFTLVNGTQGDNFRIDTSTYTNDSVDVYAYGSFNREANPVWKIGVLATENLPPKLTNFTYIYVDVLDENDNSPSDGSMRIIVNAYNGKFKGGIIGKPYYKDDDHEGDTNTYTLDSQSPGNYFKLNSNTGDITAPENIPLGRYKLITTIKQGGSTVKSNVQVLVRRIDPEAVKHAVAMQFMDMRKPGYFVGDYYDKFVEVMSGILGVSSDAVQVFSVQKAKDNLISVDVFFAVSDGDNKYKKPLEIINDVVDKQDRVKNLGLKLSAIGIDECAKEKRKIGKCENIVFASPDYSVASGDYGKVPAPDASLTVVSMDVHLKANYSPIFPKVKTCNPENPCLNGGTCHPTVPECPGYVCKCPPGYHGPLCELTTRTFYGNSYIWVPKLTAYEMSDIEFEFTTQTADGLLLYQGPLKEGSNNGAKDFIAVALVGGRIQTHISLGHEPVVINMDKGPRLDDGEWHIVQVSRNHKVVEVIIDQCSNAVIVRKVDGTIDEDRRSCHVYGKVLGRSVYLDGFGPLQIGGVRYPNLKYPKIPYKGFRGCIRNIKDNGRMYDLENPLYVNNAPKGCALAKPCPNCNGKGYCEPNIARDSICVCNLGHSGKNCGGRGKASFYQANSYTQYLVRTSRRKRRELLPPPKALLNKYYTNIALQVKIEPDASDVVVFLSSNRMGTEFQRVDVKDHKIRYILRLGKRVLILSFPQLNVTDNVYHTVIIKREGNRASFQLDYNGYELGSTRGERTLLDMGGGTLFAGGLPNVTIVRIVEATLSDPNNLVISIGEDSVNRVARSVRSLASYMKLASDSTGLTAVVDQAKGVSLENLHVFSSNEKPKRRSKRDAPISVLGDFGGCISGASVNGADLESDPSIVVKRQNVVDGCPCVNNHCLNGGTCVNAMPPYCICPPYWTGPRCGVIITKPNPGPRGSRWANPAVISTILVVLIAVLAIIGAVLLKRRPEPLVVPVDTQDAGHVHDNIRLYHDDGGGEEDNLGYDITKLMKYTYIETTGPARPRGPRVNEELVDVPEKTPLLQSAPPGDGPTFGFTGTRPPSKMPKYVDGDDVGDFITSRVKITDREVFLAVDEIHIYRYEGDDSDVDDLSEIEDEEDEDDEYEQEFEFLKQWGTKFDKLAKLYDEVDE